MAGTQEKKLQETRQSTGNQQELHQEMHTIERLAQSEHQPIGQKSPSAQKEKPINKAIAFEAKAIAGIGIALVVVFSLMLVFNGIAQAGFAVLEKSQPALNTNENQQTAVKEFPAAPIQVQQQENAPVKAPRPKNDKQVQEPPKISNPPMDEIMATPSFTMGDPNAPVIIVEFADLQCPFARRFYTNALPKIKEAYVDTGIAYFVYRDFPLGPHDMAVPSARAVRCAEEQGKGKDLHNALFDFQNREGTGGVKFTTEDIKREAHNLGLNAGQFDECFDSEKYADVVQESYDYATTIGVRGTPTLIIGKKGTPGEQIMGAQPFETFAAAIERRLA